MNYECAICHIKAIHKRMEKFGVAEEKRNQLFSTLIKDLAEVDLEKSYSPEVARNLIESIKDHINITDPYAQEKQQSNSELMAHYDAFKKKIISAENPFETALRLAIAGNIIDFGPGHKFDIWETIDHVFSSTYAIDHSKQLKAEIEKAKTILYLGDNCGEIVLDKLFIETINHPNIYYAVRGKAVLNDATEKEANEVGIPEVAKLLSNGDDTPSTLLHRVSDDFMEIYKSADLIISKGMGNFEGLMDETDPRIFFLMMVKCQVIGNKIGADKGDFVVKRSVQE